MCRLTVKTLEWCDPDSTFEASSFHSCKEDAVLFQHTDGLDNQVMTWMRLDEGMGKFGFREVGLSLTANGSVIALTQGAG